MLTYEQLKHFTDRGWVIQKDVFSDDFMDSCLVAMDEIAAKQPPNKTGEDIKVVHGLINLKKILAT